MAKEEKKQDRQRWTNTYKSKYLFASVRMTHRMGSLIKAEAARQGQSMSEYILQAIKERMARDKAARSEETTTIDEEKE